MSHSRIGADNTILSDSTVKQSRSPSPRLFPTDEEISQVKLKGMRLAYKSPVSTEDIYNVARLLWKQTEIGVNLFKDDYHLSFVTEVSDPNYHYLLQEEKYIQLKFALRIFERLGDYKKSLLYIEDIKFETTYYELDRKLFFDVSKFAVKLNIQEDELVKMSKEAVLAMNALDKLVLEYCQYARRIPDNDLSEKVIQEIIDTIRVEIYSAKILVISTKQSLLNNLKKISDQKYEDVRNRNNRSPFAPIRQFGTFALVRSQSGTAIPMIQKPPIVARPRSTLP